jgi:hypothetical protein
MLHKSMQMIECALPRRSLEALGATGGEGGVPCRDTPSKSRAVHLVRGKVTLP